MRPPPRGTGRHATACRSNQDRRRHRASPVTPDPTASRRRLIPKPVLIAVGVVAFLAVSFELARYLTAQNAERSAVYALLQDAAHGDAAAVTARLQNCRGACAADVSATVRRVRRPGELKLLSYTAARSPLRGSRTSRARVAWATEVASGGRAVVQCVTVRRAWSLASGASITLLRLSAPIPPETGC